MTDWRAWAATVGNPTVDRGRASFPFDRTAKTVLDNVPDGLIASEKVLDGFLDPPAEREDWYSYRVWREAFQELRFDDGVDGNELGDLKARFTRVQENLERWAALRPEMPDGYATTIPAEMRKAGSTAYDELAALTKGPLTELCARDDVAAETKTALDNLGQCLWEHIQCCGIELEASGTSIPVDLVRHRVEAAIVAPWQSGVTPENVDSGGIAIASHRLGATTDGGEGTGAGGGDGDGGEGTRDGDGTGGEGKGTGDGGESGGGEPGGGEPGGGEPGGGEPGGGLIEL
ncbi:hypothetical protein E8D34_07305 [Nocardioides sp. GY 10113]|uniref:hypothetical protein n=1 Tax=Nocardioides sp. GY 10113 TaxID=2569761 RepID=UPI0010A76F72|nr:hypothetical protein [Nocardioides sp. GY 10113]TIC88084.1 hypothetical protein E8D34_07305 [Nocardioides sp. GY 10113]